MECIAPDLLWKRSGPSPSLLRNNPAPPL